jgi:tetratricopeptide (TPR) repeat protein
MLLFSMAVVQAAVGGGAVPGLSSGYVHFYNLEFDQALAEFRAQAAAAPDDPNPQNHIAHAILYREMYRVGALESEMVTGHNAFLRRPKVAPSAADTREFEGAIARSIELASAMVARNPRDARAVYSLGVAYGLRANYNWLVRKAWLDSLRDATNARKLHTRAFEIDPTFVDALLVQGIHEYVLGSLSLPWRMLGFIAGMRGDRESGIGKVRRVATEGHSNRWEARILLAVVYRRDHQPALAVPLVRELIAAFPRNFLLLLELSQMYADLGNKAEALAPLNRLDREKSAGAKHLDHLSSAKIHYFRGNVEFWYRDLEPALADLRVAAANADSLDANAAAYTWLRLGMTLDLLGRRQEALEAYERVLAQWPDSDPGHDARQYRSKAYRRSDSGA